MPAITFSESKYECPCGYKFIQSDGTQFGKLKMVRRLHGKKCKVAKEVNKLVTPQYAKDKTAGTKITKDSLKQLKEFMDKSMYNTLNVADK
jgi:hypothetical protein